MQSMKLHRKPRQWHQLLVFALLALTLTSAQALENRSGNLEQFLKEIRYGVAGEDTWQEPDTSRIQAFAGVMQRFLDQEFKRADRAARQVGYRVVRYRDTAPGGTIHYILLERYQLPDSRFTGGGTYVLNPQGVNLALEVPHPVYDRHTAAQGVESYLQVGARLLALAGTHRRNSSQRSPCSGSYQKSDAVHYDRHLFQVAHEQISLHDTATLFVQLHGFGTKSLLQLQNQCGTANTNLVNLSEGVNYLSDPREESLLQILHRKITGGGVVASCVYGNQTSSLGGTHNTGARFSNDSPDICYEDAGYSSRRFVHLEQSESVRSSERKRLSGYLAAAVAEYFTGQ